MLKTYTVHYKLGDRLVPTQVCARNRGHLKDVIDERCMDETVARGGGTFFRDDRHDHANMASDLLYQGKAAAANHALIWAGMIASRCKNDGWQLLHDNSPIHKMCHYMHSMEMRSYVDAREKQELVALCERFERSIPGLSPHADQPTRYQIGDAAPQGYDAYVAAPIQDFRSVLKPPTTRELDYLVEEERERVALEAHFRSPMPYLRLPYKDVTLYEEDFQPHIDEPERTRALKQVEHGRKLKMDQARKFAASLKAIHVKKMADKPAPAVMKIGDKEIPIKDLTIGFGKATDSMQALGRVFRQAGDAADAMSQTVFATLTDKSMQEMLDAKKKATLRLVMEDTFGMTPKAFDGMITRTVTGRSPIYPIKDIFPKPDTTALKMTIHRALYGAPPEEDRALTVHMKATELALTRQAQELQKRLSLAMIPMTMGIDIGSLDHTAAMLIAGG